MGDGRNKLISISMSQALYDEVKATCEQMSTAAETQTFSGLVRRALVAYLHGSPELKETLCAQQECLEVAEAALGRWGAFSDLVELAAARRAEIERKVVELGRDARETGTADESAKR